jgi:TRAP-type C4-dicarboxylate transport system permease large subunit
LKRILVALAVCLCLAFPSCKGIFTPDEKGNIVIDGALSINMTSYGRPEFDGFVKNTGNKTSYNCKVTIIVYSDTAKRNIIDTALGFPATLGDIKPGERKFFDAVCFSLNAVAQIVAYETEISWLDR